MAENPPTIPADNAAMPDISVIIVNYNAADLITNCLDSVLAQENVSSEILVVDNASSDDSLAVLEAYTPAIRLIASNANLGFGRANNLAARSARGRYLYFLNPDATLMDTHALATLLREMDHSPRIGLAGTPLLNQKHFDEGKPKYRYPDAQHLRHPLPDLPGEIAWVIGASMIVRRDVFEAVGGFDEDFFLYGEEADLCWRIREAGFLIGHIPQVNVFHLGGGSERRTDHYALTLKKHNGLHLFYRKHYHPEDIRRLLKKNTRRAFFRKLNNRLLHTLTGRGKYQHKHAHYQAIHDSSRAALSDQ